MSYAVRISESAMKALRASAELHNRSITGQAEHWLRLGRAFEQDPRFNLTHIEQALQGRLEPDQLSDAEHDLYFDRLTEQLMNPSPVEDALFEAMRARGDGVGMDDQGNLVFDEKRDAA